MKKFKLGALTLLVLFAVVFNSCKEDDKDEDKTSLVNFSTEAYEISASDLQPVIVSLILDSPASKNSTIAISFSGANAGSAFTTTPALAGSALTIPIASGDDSVSFTVNFNKANLPVGDFVLTMAMGAVGSGLIKGSKTECVINVANEVEVIKSFVNFYPETYNLISNDLKPVVVSLTLDKPASEISTIAISFSGAIAGTEFTTTPALSGSTLSIPIAVGAVSGSFTVNFNQANMPAGNVVLTMTMGDVGSGLAKGLKTEAVINVAYIELTALPYIESFDEACTGEGDFSPPIGWVVKNTKENQAGSGGSNTGAWKCTRFAVTGGGVIGNAFVGGSPDLSESETWLISPILGIITSGNKLSFEADLRFNDVQAGYEWYDIMVSTDYNGLNFETATWTRFDAAYSKLAANDVELDNSETFSEISLVEFAGGSVTFAFIYRSSKSGNAAAMRVGEFNVI